MHEVWERVVAVEFYLDVSWGAAAWGPDRLRKLLFPLRNFRKWRFLRHLQKCMLVRRKPLRILTATDGHRREYRATEIFTPTLPGASPYSGHNGHSGTATERLDTGQHRCCRTPSPYDLPSAGSAVFRNDTTPE